MIITVRQPSHPHNLPWLVDHVAKWSDIEVVYQGLTVVVIITRYVSVAMVKYRLRGYLNLEVKEI